MIRIAHGSFRAHVNVSPRIGGREYLRGQPFRNAITGWALRSRIGDLENSAYSGVSSVSGEWRRGWLVDVNLVRRCQLSGAKDHQGSSQGLCPGAGELSCERVGPFGTCSRVTPPQRPGGDRRDGGVGYRRVDPGLIVQRKRPFARPQHVGDVVARHLGVAWTVDPLVTAPKHTAADVLATNATCSKPSRSRRCWSCSAPPRGQSRVLRP